MFFFLPFILNNYFCSILLKSLITMRIVLKKCYIFFIFQALFLKIVFCKEFYFLMCLFQIYYKHLSIDFYLSYISSVLLSCSGWFRSNDTCTRIWHCVLQGWWQHPEWGRNERVLIVTIAARVTGRGNEQPSTGNPATCVRAHKPSRLCT